MTDIRHATFIFYADDAVIYRAAQVLFQLQRAFHNIQHTMKLVLNANKTQLMMSSKAQSIGLFYRSQLFSVLN